MEIGLNPAFFCPDSPKKGTEPLFAMFGRLVKNGFTQFDFLSDVKREDYLAHAEACRNAAEKVGAEIHQSHAPLGRYRREMTLEDVTAVSLRAVEAAKLLGTRFLVVHADEYRFAPGEDYCPERILPVMYDYISRIVDAAAPCGIKVCIENVFEEGRYPDMERSRFGSTLEELLGLVDRFDRRDVGVCWDFGHALCAFGSKTTENFLQAVPYIECTHLHDNNGKSDQHMLPLTGKNDWETEIGALKKSGYTGNLSYELHCGTVPDELLDEYLHYCRALGDYLLGL